MREEMKQLMITLKVKYSSDDIPNVPASISWDHIERDTKKQMEHALTSYTSLLRERVLKLQQNEVGMVNPRDILTLLNEEKK